jgi:hypothetical protein
VSATVIDIAGHQYGRLYVVKRSGTSKFGGAIWECLCDCGGIVHVRGSNLRRGANRSCGCLRGGRSDK